MRSEEHLGICCRPSNGKRSSSAACSKILQDIFRDLRPRRCGKFLPDRLRTDQSLPFPPHPWTGACYLVPTSSELRPRRHPSQPSIPSSTHHPPTTFDLLGQWPRPDEIHLTSDRTIPFHVRVGSDWMWSESQGKFWVRFLWRTHLRIRSVGGLTLTLGSVPSY